VVTAEGRRERFQRQQRILHHLGVVADRLSTADRERTAAIAAAHRQGLSVRQIAAAVRLSSARVHQLLHAPASETNVLAAALWEGGQSAEVTETQAPVAAAAGVLRECTDWLERLDRGEVVTVNLNEPTEVATNYVAVDKVQVRQVLQRLARDLEGLAAGCATLTMGPAISRQERFAGLVPEPPRLSPREERAQLRRQLGLDP
jgi:hypothetical protein